MWATGAPSRCSSRISGWNTIPRCVPIPDHACFAPEDLAEIAAQLGLKADADDSVEEALAAVPQEARVLIFGSLYLAGAVLAANDEVPD
jgi:dihydrofolate synthase / folylpolyglutamate synthase